MSRKNIQGVGINLRLEFLDDILRESPSLPFLEIIVENWFSPGPQHKKLEELRENYEISFHCVGMNLGGEDELNWDYLKKVKDLKEKYCPKHLSDHLCFQAHGGNHHHDLLPFPLNQATLENVSERVKAVQDFFGEEILIENLSYYLEFEESKMSESEFLKELNKKTSCFYLLDLNNIWVNSKNLNISIDDFLKDIDWSNVREVHLAGAEKFEKFYVDTHGSPIHPEVLNLVRKHRKSLINIPIIYERDRNLKGLTGMLSQIDLVKEALYG